MKGSKSIHFLVAGLLVIVYYAGEATEMLFLAMPIILPVGL
jgi:hypothetical protein